MFQVLNMLVTAWTVRSAHADCAEHMQILLLPRTCWYAATAAHADTSRCTALSASHAVHLIG